MGAPQGAWGQQGWCHIAGPRAPVWPSAGWQHRCCQERIPRALLEAAGDSARRGLTWGRGAGGWYVSAQPSAVCFEKGNTNTRLGKRLRAGQRLRALGWCWMEPGLRRGWGRGEEGWGCSPLTPARRGHSEAPQGWARSSTGTATHCTAPGTPHHAKGSLRPCCGSRSPGSPPGPAGGCPG